MKSAKPAADPLQIAVFGASGFGGAELLRLLAQHPATPRVLALAHTHAGKPISALHPHLHRAYPGVFASELGEFVPDVLFAALPHGEFAKRWSALQSQLAPHTVVIDLSGDFRLRSAEEFAFAYGGPHPCPDALASFEYGLVEFQPERLRLARRIANPGCFATALALTLLPLAGMAEPPRLAISAVTGSTGSGAALSEGTHHPTRAHDFRAYKVFGHQHEYEVLQLLRHAAGPGAVPNFSFVPHSAPMVRGIYLTAQAELNASQASIDWRAHFARYYAAQTLVRVQTELPRTATVIGSNECVLHVEQRGKQLAIIATLDNLLKGMAGQAVQNMNLALGLPVDTGVTAPSLYP
jgi:LysW-gamma-L-alpha-aminoadipyl-6-phosphate/LysW-L-glutamyl-5-phosphate reductase